MSLSTSTPNKDAGAPPLPGAWLVVGLLWGVGCLNYIDRVMLNTMRDSIKAAVPMRDDEFGMLTTAFLVVYGILSPVGGWFADRFSRSRIIIFSLAVWSVVTWVTSYAHTFNELLATRAIMGISEACYIPAALALIADYHQGATRSFATGIHMSGLYAGLALGGMGGGASWLVRQLLFLRLRRCDILGRARRTAAGRSRPFHECGPRTRPVCRCAAGAGRQQAICHRHVAMGHA